MKASIRPIAGAKLRTIAVLLMAATGAGGTAVVAAAAPGAIESTPATRLKPTPFTVRILPLDSAGSGVADKAALEKLQRQLVARLRAIPGLTLLTPESASVSANYEILVRPAVMRGVQMAHFNVRRLSRPAPTLIEERPVTSIPRQPEVRVARAPGDPDRGANFIADTIANLRGMDPAFGSRTLAPADGRGVVADSNHADVIDLNIIPSALLDRMEVVRGYEERVDPQQYMEDFITRLQADTFPADPSLKADLFDPRVDIDRRQKALHLLLTPAGDSTPPEPAVVRAGVELATTAKDPARRAAIWKRLRDSRSPEVMGPLVQALATEQNAQVRLGMVAILSGNPGAEPQARAALESVAATDREQLVRMAAQRALTANSGWNQYVVATLANARLTDEQRLAPLAYMQSLAVYVQQPAFDDVGIRTLDKFIAQAKSYTAGVRGAAYALGLSANPLALDVISDVIRPRARRSRTSQEIRDTLLWGLGRLFFSSDPVDPRISKAVEEVAARDSDPAVRGTAQALLDSAARTRSRMSEVLR